MTFIKVTFERPVLQTVSRPPAELANQRSAAGDRTWHPDATSADQVS